MWQWIKDAVFPERCLLCKREGSWLCNEHNTFCGAPKNKVVFNNIDEIYAATAYYHPTTKRMIEYFKFRGFSNLADIMGEKIHQTTPPEIFKNAILVPIPLHWTRKLWRGFNQAEKIAQAIQRKNPHIQLSTQLLRIRRTKQQARLRKQERSTNLEKAFEWQGKTIPKKIILIDDVIASGKTMDTAAALLRKKGATHISGIVFARGGKPCQNLNNEN